MNNSGLNSNLLLFTKNNLRKYRNAESTSNHGSIEFLKLIENLPRKKSPDHTVL